MVATTADPPGGDARRTEVQGKLDMNRKLLIGISGGALALALAGGAAFAGPSLGRSTAAAAQPGPTPTAQPPGPKQKGRQQVNTRRLALLLGRATAEVSGIKPKEVLAELRAGKSLAQIAQEHGKTDKDI